MIAQTVILWLYGLCFWGATINFPAWARLLMREMHPARKVPWHCDARFMSRIGLTVLSFGIAGLSGSRFFDAVLYSHTIPIPSPWVALFVASMAMAEPFFLRIDEIHASERKQKSIGWRLYWVGVVTGTVLLVILKVLP